MADINNFTYKYLIDQTNENLEHFIEQFSEQVINNEASLFVGSGVSRNSGYPGWRDLLSGCADKLKLDMDEVDLYSLAQYYANKHSDSELRKIISQKINRLPKSNELLNYLLEIYYRKLIIFLEVLKCRQSLMFQGFPAFLVTEDVLKSP